MLFIFLWNVYLLSAEITVLDPSLYLSPSPPMSDGAGGVAPAALWSRSTNVKPVPNFSGTSWKLVDKQLPQSNRKPNPMEKAKLFWPARESQYKERVTSIQVPLTFSLSGLYGKYSPGTGSGIIASSYGTVSEIGGKAISTVTGNGYGGLRTYPSMRIYGRENGQVWSGWGNGKWGHYGKG